MIFGSSQRSLRAKRNLKQSNGFRRGFFFGPRNPAKGSSIPDLIHVGPSTVFRSKRNDAEISARQLLLSESTTSYGSTSSSDLSDQYSGIVHDTNYDVAPGMGCPQIPTTAEKYSGSMMKSHQHPRAPVVAVSSNASSASSVYSHPFDEGPSLPGKQHPRQTPQAHDTTRVHDSACAERGPYKDEQDLPGVRTSTSAYDDPALALDDSVDDSSTESESLILDTPTALLPSPPRAGTLRHSSHRSTTIRSQSGLSSASPYYDSSVPADKQLSWGIELMDRARSNLASQRRKETLRLFSQATRYFGAVVAAVQQAGPLNRNSALEIVALLHAARCLRYTSGIVTNPNEAVQLLYKVTRLLDRAREQVDLLRGNETCTTVPKTTTACSKATTEVSLDTMTVETLQFQADVLLHKLNDRQQALFCYEEIIRQLLYLEETQSSEDDDDDDDASGRSLLFYGICFVPMSQEKHTELLRESLSTFLKSFEGYFLEDASYSFDAFEDALNLLRERLEETICGNDEWVDMVASSYKRLSEIYEFRHEDDRAALALQDFAVVKLLRSGEPCSDAVDILNAMGEMHEETGNFSEALECYELNLLALCRYYLNSGKKVAQALVNVARVKERRDGESTESLKYWRATIALMTLNDTEKGSPDGTPVVGLQDYRFILDKYGS